MSESLEMYLSTILSLRGSRTEPVPLSSLANALSIASVSANEMCRKLQERGLVIYRPYKGVTLTEESERHGRSVLRRRGLWVVFLTQKLGIEPVREEIVLKHKAPLGDPLEFSVKGYRVSLRKEEAAEIIVEVAVCP